MGNLHCLFRSNTARRARLVVAVLCLVGTGTRSLAQGGGVTATATPPAGAPLRSDWTLRASPRTGFPNRISTRLGALTEASGAEPEAIARDFVFRHRGLLGVTVGDLEGLRLVRRYTSAHNGITHFFFEQTIDGIEVFESEARLNIDRDGRVLNYSGDLTPQARAAVNTFVPLLAADRAAELARDAAQMRSARKIGDDRLVLFPAGPGVVRLSWRVELASVDSPDRDEIIVDATDGTVLSRRHLTTYSQMPAHGQVFTRDSPVPDWPRESRPFLVSRMDVRFNGRRYFDDDDPHSDWWNGSGLPRTTTISNNGKALIHGDASYFAQASAGENFSFPLDLEAEPSSSKAAAVTNVFYWLNRLHDLYYWLGFTEAAGNAQTSNFGLGGEEGDGVEARVHETHDCTAYAVPTSDGNPPGLNVGTCPPLEYPEDYDLVPCPGPASGPARDGAFDNTILVHEFTHIVTGRLVSIQASSSSTGEGWSDFMALAILAEPGDDPAGAYALGTWACGTLRGNRCLPYSTDRQIFPHTFASPPECSWLAGGYARAQIWAEALWLARDRIMRRYDSPRRLPARFPQYLRGAKYAMQLVVDGMTLSPSLPSFIDARDAVLLADQQDYGGAHQCALWDAFAEIGLGLSASQADGERHEAFDSQAPCQLQCMSAGQCQNGACVGGDLDLSCLFSGLGSQLQLWKEDFGQCIRCGRFIDRMERVAQKAQSLVDEGRAALGAGQTDSATKLVSRGTRRLLRIERRLDSSSVARRFPSPAVDALIAKTAELRADLSANLTAADGTLPAAARGMHEQLEARP